MDTLSDANAQEDHKWRRKANTTTLDRPVTVASGDRDLRVLIAHWGESLLGGYPQQNRDQRFGRNPIGGIKSGYSSLKFLA